MAVPIIVVHATDRILSSTLREQKRVPRRVRPCLRSRDPSPPWVRSPSGPDRKEGGERRPRCGQRGAAASSPRGVAPVHAI